MMQIFGSYSENPCVRNGRNNRQDSNSLKGRLLVCPVIITGHANCVHVAICVIQTEIPETMFCVPCETQIHPVIEWEPVIINLCSKSHVIMPGSKFGICPALSRQRYAITAHAGPRHVHLPFRIDFPIGKYIYLMPVVKSCREFLSTVLLRIPAVCPHQRVTHMAADFTKFFRHFYVDTLRCALAYNGDYMG